jgi:uncharacterized protein YciU (UPF0263 family)
LITRIFSELKKLNSPKFNDPMKKWAKDLNKTLSKEEFQMVKRQMKNEYKRNISQIFAMCLMLGHFSVYTAPAAV